MAIGRDSFDYVEYSGTFFVGLNLDDDYAGFVFGYQNNRLYFVFGTIRYQQTDHTFCTCFCFLQKVLCLQLEEESAVLLRQLTD